MSSGEYFNSNESYSSHSYYQQQEQQRPQQPPYESQGYQQSYPPYAPPASHISPPEAPQYSYDAYIKSSHEHASTPAIANQATYSYNEGVRPGPYQQDPYGYTQQPAPYAHQVDTYAPQPPTQHAPYQQYPQYPPAEAQPYVRPPPPPPEYVDERGIAGALAGGIAGGYGGHQMGHGVIGAVGGAVVGSKLEDRYKKEHHKKEKSHFWQRRHSSSSSSSSDDEKVKPVAPPPVHHNQQPLQSAPVMAGNFSGSCANITLDGDYDLIALCRSVDGQQKLSSISLNNHLTNTNGQLFWVRDGGGFGGSSRNVKLIDNGRILEAELGTGHGGWNRTTIRLDEKITNNNGELKYLD